MSFLSAAQQDIFTHGRHHQINSETSVQCPRVPLVHILGDRIRPQSSTLGSVLAFSCLAFLGSSVEEEEEK